MSTKPDSKRFFFKIQYFCNGLSILLLVWLGCHLFIRSCGGPFPQRTRGPFAEYRYYQLADFPSWENQIEPDPVTGRTRIEDLMEKGFMPPIQFGDPFAATANTGSATPSASTNTK